MPPGCTSSGGSNNRDIKDMSGRVKGDKREIGRRHMWDNSCGINLNLNQFKIHISHLEVLLQSTSVRLHP